MFDIFGNNSNNYHMQNKTKTTVTKTKNPDFTIKELFVIVEDYLGQMVNDDTVHNVEIAEYQKISDGYSITLSYYIKRKDLSDLGFSSFAPLLKNFKTFILDNNAKIIQVKIHEFSK